MHCPEVHGFFDKVTNTVSYVVADPSSRKAGIIDPVLDFDPASAMTSTTSADVVVAAIREQGLTVDWILETHVHADHLTAAPYIQAQLGGTIGIGVNVVDVQQAFSEVFNFKDLTVDGSQFGRLFADGDTFNIGDIECRVMHTPGHTPACVTYVIGDAAFVGDTLFMPDYGTARTDFPGGDAGALYDSIQDIFSLPPETRVYLCHDYKAPGRDAFTWETTVREQQANNIHVRKGITREDFVAMRNARDATLGMPKLILPSIQVNVRGGRFPDPEDNGVSYLKLPLDLRLES